MTFNEAYVVAMQKSVTFRNFDTMVRESIVKGKPTACMTFAVSADEMFYYGFDGVDLQTGKHSSKRAAQIVKEHRVLLIL